MAEHPDRDLSRLAAGLLDSAERARLAEHARTCAQCAERYDRAVPLSHVLEGADAFAPSEADLAHLESRGLERALASAAPARAPWLAWLGRLSLGLAVATALVLAVLYLRPKPIEDEFTSRGGGEGQSTLRVFCAAPGRPVAELQDGGRCPRGATLAFAASAPAGLGFASVEVRGQGGALRSEALGVRGRPGAEAPLEFTTPLSFEPGEVEVVVGFGASAEQANAARFQPVPRGAERRQLRLTEVAP